MIRRAFTEYCLSVMVFAGLSCSDNNPVDTNERFDPGPILFISDKSGTQQLNSMNEDGSDVKQLTYDAGFPITDARWSPDGTKIAFTSPVGGVERYGPAIYVMNADGTGTYKLTNSKPEGSNYATGIHPVWSPDSRRIAFSRLMIPELLGNYDIFLIDVDGANEEWVTKTRDSTEIVTDWGSDGRSLLGHSFDYTRRDSLGRLVENTSVVAFDLQGRYSKSWGRIGVTYSWPVWSISGGKIAFNSNDDKTQDIYLMNSDGSNQTKLTNGKYRFTFPVSWSPSDTVILYDTGSGDSMGRPFGKILTISLKTGLILDLTPFKESNAYSQAVSWRRR